MITNDFEFKQFKFKKELNLKGFPDPISREALNNLNETDTTAKNLYQKFQKADVKGICIFYTLSLPSSFITR